LGGLWALEWASTVLGGLWALEWACYSFGRFVGVRVGVEVKIFYLASKLLEFQFWAVCGRKSGRGIVLGGLWALEWAWQLTFLF